jgi:broad specificity phosphatase PhoE
MHENFDKTSQPALRRGRLRRNIAAAAAAGTAAVLFATSAWADTTITFVRHGESEGNASGYIDTGIPGPHLTGDPTDPAADPTDPTADTSGWAQAKAIAAVLAGDGVAYDGIYASTMIRTQETATPFADTEGKTITVLGEYDKDNPQRRAGIQEISAGVLEGVSQDKGVARIGYALVPLGWVLGLRFLAIPGGENGNEFDDRVDNALADVQTGGDLNDGDLDGDGHTNAVVFSHGMTIAAWTLMNVDNPQPLLMLTSSLGNTETVVVAKNDDGTWTLKQWGDQEIGPANYPTKIFVNFRDLIVAPQTALYNMRLPLLSLDLQAIAQTGAQGVRDVGAATVKFVTDSVTDTADAVRGLVPRAASQPGASVQSVTATRSLAATPETSVGLDESTKPESIPSVSDLKSKGTSAAADARDQAQTSVTAATQLKKAHDAKATDTDSKVKDDVKKAKKDVKSKVKAAAGRAHSANRGASDNAA